MKIIGWEKNGNVIRFHLAKSGLVDWSGDDWGDSPYEHNASTAPMYGIDGTSYSIYVR